MYSYHQTRTKLSLLRVSLLNFFYAFGGGIEIPYDGGNSNQTPSHVCDWGEWQKTTAPTGCNHYWGSWEITIHATCTTSGERRRVCAIDNTHVEIEPIDPIGHDMGPWVVTTQPTLTAAGVETRTCRCTSCSHNETRPIAPPTITS